MNTVMMRLGFPDFGAQRIFLSRGALFMRSALLVSFFSSFPLGAMLVPASRVVTKAPKLVVRPYATKDSQWDTKTKFFEVEEGEKESHKGISIKYNGEEFTPKDLAVKGLLCAKDVIIQVRTKDTCLCVDKYALSDIYATSVPILQAYKNYTYTVRNIDTATTLYGNDCPDLIKKLKLLRKDLCPKAPHYARRIMIERFAARSLLPLVLGGLTYKFGGDHTWFQVLVTFTGSTGTLLSLFSPYEGLYASDKKTDRERSVTRYFVYHTKKINELLDKIAREAESKKNIKE